MTPGAHTGLGCGEGNPGKCHARAGLCLLGFINAPRAWREEHMLAASPHSLDIPSPWFLADCEADSSPRHSHVDSLRSSTFFLWKQLSLLCGRLLFFFYLIFGNDVFTTNFCNAMQCHGRGKSLLLHLGNSLVSTTHLEKMLLPQNTEIEASWWRPAGLKFRLAQQFCS